MRSWYLAIILAVCSVSLCSYDLNHSRANAYYAAITHCPPKQIQSWTCKLCPNVTTLTNVTYIQNSKTHIVGFVGYQRSTKSIIYSFRSTVDFINFFEDVSFLRVPISYCRGCEIHLGFYEAFRSVENKIISTLLKLMAYDPDAQIISIGHSLGGALATITAIELQIKYGKVKQLHTYGGPRIGDENLAKFLKLKLPNTFRVIHYRDLAPHLPFLENGYRHPPTQILFDEEMKNFTVCNDNGEDLHCSNKYFPEYSEKYHQKYWFDFDC